MGVQEVAVTIDFFAACCEELALQAVPALVLIWDNASWHKSQMVRTWIGDHNQAGKQTGKGVRILPCLFPSKSPWLNPIELKAGFTANATFPKLITS